MITGQACNEALVKEPVLRRNEYSVYFERIVTMTYSTEVWARNEVEALELAKKESDDHSWVEGDLVDEKKPIIRSVRQGASQ